MNDRTQGVLALVAAALLWSFGGICIKMISIAPMATAGARSLIAFVVVLLYARRIPRRITAGQLLGAIAYAGTVTCFVLATKSTTAANAILLQYTAPIWVALLSPWLLREKISGIDWGAIVVVIGGMLLFFVDRLDTGHLNGDLLAVASGVFFALGIISLRRERHGSPLTIVILGNLITAIIGLPFLIGDLPTPTDILFLLPLGVLQLGLGYILFARGVRYVTAIEGTLIPMLEPILNPIWVAIFYMEYPSTLALLGGGIVVATVTARGIYTALRGAKKMGLRNVVDPQTNQLP